MFRGRQLGLITGADFLVRCAYQVGKAPVLPLFAAALGAGEVFLGLIVSVSTLTGMLLKPLFGVLSDRWGRRVWLLAGTGLFTGMPFAYHLVESPEHLLAVRLLHGTATAIYGPVTIAYVAEMTSGGRAERIGWFSLARNAGYIVGPLAGGAMLVFMDPVTIFTVVGFVSALAFLPVLMLPEGARVPAARRTPVLAQARLAVASALRTPSVWLAGSLDAQFLVAKYAVKTFLPLQALSLGVSPAMVGVVLAAQEAASMALSPLGGRIGDRVGYMKSVPAGMLGMAAALVLMAVLLITAQYFFFHDIYTIALAAAAAGALALARGWKAWVTALFFLSVGLWWSSQEKDGCSFWWRTRYITDKAVGRVPYVT